MSVYHDVVSEILLNRLRLNVVSGGGSVGRRRPIQLLCVASNINPTLHEELVRLYRHFGKSIHHTKYCPMTQ
jgi:hypothetical protein